MKYLSVCSGIEAATVAWQPLGWHAVGFAEIEAFPSAVLAHHYGSNLPGEPLCSNGVPNFGDFTTLIDEPPACDLLVGGTPCQAFSVAGARRSLEDDRGNLTLAFVRLADAIRHVHGGPGPIIVWENVPGILSTRDNAFGCFLGMLSGEEEPLQPAGKRWTDAGLVLGPERAIAWRVLDAQYLGLAQRRRRVFVVAGPSGSFDPAKVLFEFEGMRRDSPPSREAGEEASENASDRVGMDCGKGGAFGGGNTAGPIDIATAVNAHGGGRMDFDSETFVVTECAPDLAPCLAKSGRGVERVGDPRGQDPLIAFSCKDYGADAGEVSPTLRAMGHGDSHANAGGQVAVAIQERAVSTGVSGPNGKGFRENVAYTLEARNRPQNVCHDYIVRRLTPTESERLQGLPDDYTLVPYRNRPRERCPDGPRYKAIGNSMAADVMHWIGQRIEYVERAAL